jgi:hypothetical protein
VRAPTFVYKVGVEVEFTTEELNMLGLLAANHYDAHCRSIAAVGGFLYGMQNHQKFALEEDAQAKPVHDLNFREIDTLCKVLEMRDMLSPVQSVIALNRPKLLDVATALALRLKLTLHAINDEHARIHNEQARRLS